MVVRDGIVIHYSFRDEAAAVLRAHPTLDTVARYDLHQPQRKARNAALDKVLDDIDRWQGSVEPHVEECPVGTRELFDRLLDAVRPPKRKARNTKSASARRGERRGR